MRSDETRNAWRDDFPLTWQEDEYVTRREFTRFLGLTSLALFLGTAWIGVAQYVKRWRAKPKGARPIATVDALAVGAAKIFHYPTGDDPCILIRLSADHFVAYEQSCTHLSCPVIYESAKARLRCPCHEGIFAVADGSVVSGPPQRSLAQLTVSIRGNEVWVQDKT